MMYKLETLKNQIAKKGYPVEEKTIVKADGTQAPCLIVRHDYPGFYTDALARRTHNVIKYIATRAGWKAEPRGHCTATYIY